MSAGAAVALLSGGLDSTVAAALHARATGPVEAALFVDYGQRAAGPEEHAARAVAEVLGAELICTQLPLLAQISSNALVSREIDLPAPDPDRLDELASSTVDAVWVPNRNGVLVNLAAAVAEARGVPFVVVGFNAEEAETFPDNSEEFMRHLDRCLEDSTRGRVRVTSPTVRLTKTELVAAGRAVGAPIDLSWSCYDGGPEPCGRCESCRRRERAITGSS